MASAGRTDAYVVGPGLADEGRLQKAVDVALGSGKPVVLDAEALTKVTAGPVVITPRRRVRPAWIHAGEDRIAAVRDAAAHLGVVVLLKGSVTVVATPDGHVFINTTAVPIWPQPEVVMSCPDCWAACWRGISWGPEPDLRQIAQIAACSVGPRAGGQAGLFPATSVDIADKVAQAVAWASDGR